LQKQNTTFKERKEFLLSSRAKTMANPDDSHLIKNPRSLSDYRKHRELEDDSHQAVEDLLRNYNGPQAK
jgi:hypothetical protein